MSHPLRWLTISLILALTWTTPTAARVNVTAAAGFAGLAKDGTWMPVRVTVDNDRAESLRGELVIEEATLGGYVARYRRAVELAKHARQTYTLYIPARSQGLYMKKYEPGFAVLQLEVKLRPEQGKEIVVPVAVQVFPSDQALVLEASGKPQVKERDKPQIPPLPQVRFVPIGAEGLPDHWTGYDGVDAVVLPNLIGVSEEQFIALLRWLHDGGTLVAWRGPWTDICIGSSSLCIDSLRQALQFRWWGPRSKKVLGPVPLAPTAQAGVREGCYGRGRVVFLERNYDAVARPTAEGWKGLLGLNRPLGQRALSAGRQVLTTLGNAVARLPTLRTPPLALVILFLLLYLLLLVPANYFLLRRYRRKELAWLTTPLIVAVFSVGAYGIGYRVKGHELSLHTFSFVDAQAGQREAAAITAFGLFSPNKARYQIDLPHASPGVWELTSEGDPFQQINYPEPQVRGSLDVVQGETTRLANVHVNMWAMRLFGTQTRVGLGEGVSADLRWEEKEKVITGTLHNGTPYTFAPAVLVFGGHTQRFERLAPGTHPLQAIPLAALNEDQHGTLKGLCSPLYRPSVPPGINAEAVDNALNSLVQPAVMSGPRRNDEPVLWAWTQEPASEVRLGGHQPAEHHFTLFRFTLPLIRTARGQAVVLPNRSNYRNNFLPHGRYEFPLTLPFFARGCELERAALHVHCTAGGQTVLVEGFNRRLKRWDTLGSNLDGYQVLALPRPGDYFGPQTGTLLVRLISRGHSQAALHLLDVLAVTKEAVEF